jgi:hypothetical protein
VGGQRDRGDGAGGPGDQQVGDAGGRHAAEEGGDAGAQPDQRLREGHGGDGTDED